MLKLFVKSTYFCYHSFKRRLIMVKKLFNERKMLDKALRDGYAVGAFNFSSIEVMRAIVDAAQNVNSPVILAMSQGGLKFTSAEYICKVMRAVLDNTTIPIALHLDHGKSFEIVKSCIDAGFNSVMIDGSYLPFKQNVELTRRVVDYAHDHGVVVEGELGTLAGIEDDVQAEHSIYTKPEEAAEFVALTNVDSLAVAIGTSHGAYKFKTQPTLRFDILSQIEQLLPKYPIVLHGASSVPPEILAEFNNYGGIMKGAKGVPPELLRQACGTAVSKINCDTDIRIKYTASIRKYLLEHPECFTPREYLQFAKDEMRAFLEDKMTNVLGSAGHGDNK